MDQLLNFLLEKITGSSDFEIKKEEGEGIVDYQILLPEDKAGLVIGKGGSTIKVLNRLMKVRATLEQKRVNLNVANKNTA